MYKFSLPVDCTMARIPSRVCSEGEVVVRTRGRKMSIIRDKYKVCCDKIKDEYQKIEIKSEIFNMAVKGLTNYLETPVEESDKDDYLKCIFKCRALLQS